MSDPDEGRDAFDAFGYDPDDDLVRVWSVECTDAIDTHTLAPYVSLRIGVHTDELKIGYALPADGAEWLAGKLLKAAARARAKCLPSPDDPPGPQDL